MQRKRHPFTRLTLVAGLLLTVDVAVDLSAEPLLPGEADRVPFELSTRNVLLLAADDADSNDADEQRKHVADDDVSGDAKTGLAMHESAEHQSMIERDHDRSERHENEHEHDAGHEAHESASEHADHDRMEREHEDSRDR